MSVKQKVIDLVFVGNQDPLRDIIVQEDDATSPDGVVTAPQGTFLVVDYVGNAADEDVYLNTDGSTAWTQIHNGDA